MRVRLVFFCILFGFQAFAKVDSKKIVGSTKVSDEIERYIKNLPREDAWNKWLIENGPTYGNYCGAGKGDPFYEEPCLSRLDCLCKAHDFGYSLRKYKEADQELVESILKHPIDVGADNPDHEPFLQLLALTFFAGKVAGQNMVETLEGAYKEFASGKRQLSKPLKDAIAHNEVFKQKMADIEAERRQYETGLKAQTTPSRRKIMSLGTNPVDIVRGKFGINYELLVNNKLSLRFMGSLLGSGLLSDTNLNYFNDRLGGFSFAVGSKLFVTGKPFFRGIYIEPRIGLSYEDSKKECCNEERSNALGPEFSVLVGVDYLFAMGFQVDFGIGVAYYMGYPLKDVKPGLHQYQGILPELQFSIAWAW